MRAVVINDMFCRGSILCCALLLCCLCLWPAGARALSSDAARACVHNGIASGAFAGKSVQDYRTEGWVAPLFESVSMGRKEIRNVGTPVRQGKDWIVPFVLRDHGNGNSYAVRARVSDAGGSPRVVAVENLRQLFVILGKEAQALES